MKSKDNIATDKYLGGFDPPPSCANHVRIRLMSKATTNAHMKHALYDLLILGSYAILLGTILELVVFVRKGNFQ